MPAVDTARPLSPDAVYYKAELQRVIKERDEIKRSLTAADGPAAHWRNEARKAIGQLANAQERIGGLRKETLDAQARAIGFSEELDVSKRAYLATKERLWQRWSSLDDADPLKQALWEIWTAL